jgi:ABC transporter substrate binding protein
VSRATTYAVPRYRQVSLLPNNVRSRTTARLSWFRKGLQESGYTEGQNVAIEYHLAEGHVDRLPRLTADLIDRPVIFAAGIDPAKVAKAATATIPIVFLSDVDPVNAGVVTSLNRPGGNVTGISLLGTALESKRLGLLNEIVPGAAPIGILLNPRFPDANLELHELQDAANAIKRQIIIVRASTDSEIDTAIAAVANQGAARSLSSKILSSPILAPADNWWPWRPAISCPRCARSVNLPKRAVLSVTRPTLPTVIAKPASTSEKFSRAPNPPICRSSSQQSLTS